MKHSANAGYLTLFLAVFSLFASLAAPVFAQERKPVEGEVRAVWIHTYSPRNWDIEMQRLAAARFNTVFVRVARGANSIYPSQYLAGDDFTQNLTADEMQRAIDAAHRYGLRFHAWVVCFHVGGASKQTGPAKQLYDQMAKDDRLVRGLDGTQTPFLNPGDPRNQEWEMNVTREIVEKYNVDGLHLDYIRYPDEPSYDFDYGEVSRREFEKAANKQVEKWPEDVYSGPLKWDYENWERSNIDNLVRGIHEQTKKLKPSVILSAAVWRAHRHNRAVIKQDWLLWARKGWLDWVVPMDYTTDDAQFREDIQAQATNAAGKVRLLAGIAAYKHADAAATLRQIDIARQEGADGWVLFDYKPEKQASLFDALGSATAEAITYPPTTLRVEWKVLQEPTREWKDTPPAYPIGQKISVSVTPLPNPAQTLINAMVRVETLDGQWVNWPGKIENFRWPNSSWEPQHYSFAMPQGKVRLVLSGTLTNDKDEVASFVARGPLFESFDDAPQKELVTDAKGRRVVVYLGGQASSGIVKAFEKARTRGVRGLRLSTSRVLSAQAWRRSEVFILPQLRDVAELTPELQESLRTWVNAGGTLLLTHDAVGFRWHLRLFPEIGEGKALSKTKNVLVAENTWKIAPGQWFHGFSDHVIITPGKDGVVLAHESADPDKAVLVAGKYGKGKVFLYGSLLGFGPGGEPEDEERQLLVDIAKNR